MRLVTPAAVRGPMKLTRLASTRPASRLLTPQTISSLRTYHHSRRLMAVNGQANGAAHKAGGVRTNLVPFANRLKEGRALAQDVWSIFKCVFFHGSYFDSDLPSNQ